MHCPNCGTEAPAGQKFCRACGLSLERFAQLLAELLPDAEDENVTRARQRLRQLENAAKIAGVVAGLAAVILIVSMGVNVMIETGNIGEGILLLVFAVVVVAGALIGAYYNSLREKVSARQPAQPALPLAETTNKLLHEHQSQVAMSVTEQTTARLEEKIEARHSLILLVIIVKVMIQDGAVFQGSILLMIVVSAVLALFLAYLRDERKNSASTSSNQQQRLPQVDETAKTLSEPGVEMAASVTEHTTAKLGEEVITQIEKPQPS